MNSYKSLKSSSRAEFKDKKSTFLGITDFVRSEAEVKSILANYRALYKDACHVCFAYRLGVGDSQIERYSDDGEPSNSAGPPIFGQIKSFDLSNILISVVRWYGGVNLGVGGLINAYRTAAKLAIESGKIEEIEIIQSVKLTFGYEQMPFILNFIKKHGLISSNLQLAETCELDVDLSLEICEEMLTRIKSEFQLSIILGDII